MDNSSTEEEEMKFKATVNVRLRGSVSDAAGNEPAATYEKNRQQFKMVKLESPSWTIEVPVRKNK